MEFSGLVVVGEVHFRFYSRSNDLLGGQPRHGQQFIFHKGYACVFANASRVRDTNSKPSLVLVDFLFGDFRYIPVEFRETTLQFEGGLVDNGFVNAAMFSFGDYGTIHLQNLRQKVQVASFPKGLHSIV